MANRMVRELMGRTEHTDVHPGDMEQELQWQGKDAGTARKEEAARLWDAARWKLWWMRMPAEERLHSESKEMLSYLIPAV